VTGHAVVTPAGRTGLDGAMKELIVLVAVPVFFALLLLERWVGARRGWRPPSLSETACSVSSGVLGQVSGAFTAALGLATYAWLYARAPCPWPLDAGWTWAGAFVLFDLLFYWGHRLSHVVNVAWAAHVVHHSSEEFDLATALRQPSFTFLFAWLVYAPLALLGVPPLAFAVSAGVNLVYQFWPHTRLVGRLGWFDRWFASPSNHRVHHGKNPWCIDRNFGGVLMVWDRLFGTFAEERDGEPIEFGVWDPPGSADPYWVNLHAFHGLIVSSRTARGAREWLRVWFGHPGRQPHPAARPARPGRPGAAPGPLRRSVAVALIAGAVAATTHFMAVNGRLPAGLALAYAAAIGLSLEVLRAVVGGPVSSGRGGRP